MGKNQLVALSVSIAAILVFYFGCDNLSQSQQDINQTRSKNLQITDIQNLLNEALQLVRTHPPPSHMADKFVDALFAEEVLHLPVVAHLPCSPV